MPCTKSKLDCENLVQNIVGTIESTPRDLRNNLDYLERNILNYCWLLQSISPMIDVRQIIQLIGPSVAPATDKFLREMVFTGYASSLQDIKTGFLPPPIRLCENLYEVISIELATIYGNMFTARNILNGLSAIQFLSLMIQKDNTQLATIISNAIKTALGNLPVIRRLEDVPELSDKQNLLRSNLAGLTRIITLPNEKSFILLAYPYNEALDRATVDHIGVFLHTLRITLYDIDRRQFPAIHSLFITPAIDKDDDASFFRNEAHLNYMWAFSALRFISYLESLSYDYKGQEKIVAEEFNSIFRQQKSTYFSVQEAFQYLRSKLPPRQSSIGYVCLSHFDNKNYVLLLSQPKGNSWQFPDQSVTTNIFEGTLLDRIIGRVETGCPDSSKLGYSILDIQLEKNPKEIVYSNKKVKWLQVGEAEGLLSECEKIILVESRKMWKS